MPYLPSSARNKSEYYRKLLDADIIEQNNLIKDLELRQNVSGSIDALNPTRDDDGFVVSIEDPTNPGQAAETINESVRIENKQQFFNDRYLGQVQKPFEFFTPPSSLVEEDVQIEQEEEQEKQKQAEKPTDSFRDLLIEFFELDINVSDKKIQSEMAKSGQKVLKGLQKAVMLNIIVSTKNYASFIRNVIYQDNSLKKIWKEKNLPTSSLTPTGQEYDFTKQFEFKGLDFSNLKSSLANLNTSGYR
tara:strand:+ start:986 stop:1723 length:738 start_codon:yes stop_codon:yes gene_type:complete